MPRTSAKSTGPEPEVQAAMRRLQAAERERRAAIEELIQLGALRSHVLVGDLGERIAAMYYRVELLPQFTPGHDLVDRRRRRIDVKTLHATPDKHRTIIGQPKRPCDLIFALRLHYDYTPSEALEIPIELAEAYVGANDRLSWTQKLASEPAVVHLDAAQLARGDPHSAGLKRRSPSAEASIHSMRMLHSAPLALLAQSDTPRFTLEAVASRRKQKRPPSLEQAARSTSVGRPVERVPWCRR